MGKIIKYICDNCNQEVNESQLTKVTIPAIEEAFIRNGNGIKIMTLEYHLAFEKKELCSACAKTYKQIQTNAMIGIANEWGQSNQKTSN